MGVTGLWTVVAPTARPTQLASLNRKRLAVDASIWIYQFLKAVRDKEGNALRNSHVVGFFRRICKLLYFGIKPVFVFDGGAPVLKRETVRRRARRREGRREDAARTAGKLLAVQVARAAEEEEKRRRAARERTPVEEELPPDQELVYVDEIGMTAQERQTGRGFKKKDQYHLPDLDISLESLGAPNDPRIMSQAELEEYARQFHSGEDINLYDFSKIDFESPFFLSLPAGDRYNILNAARLRSRLRMGYSKEQLDGMFPDRMAFSKFQIERVKERNELTQRLMYINGMGEGFVNQGGRIAGEKGKEYLLVKNEGVEGGWALGVVSNKQGHKREDAIDLEDEMKSDQESEESDDEEDFEDVAIEGLNRLPRLWQRKRQEVDHDMSYEDAAAEIARKRKAVYDARRAAAASQPSTAVKDHDMVTSDTLFVPQSDESVEGTEDLFEDVNLEQLTEAEEEDDDLRRAIAMSLEQPLDEQQPDEQRSGGFLTSEALIEDDEAEDFDLQVALAESRRSKYQPKTNARAQSPVAKEQQFDGPLPFESLNLGQSLLGRKKSKQVVEDLPGGFDRNLSDEAFEKEKPAQPLPVWFDAAPATNDLRHANVVDDGNDDSYLAFRQEGMDRRGTSRRHETQEVINLDVEDEGSEQREVICVDTDDEDARSFEQSSDIVGEHEPELGIEVHDAGSIDLEDAEKQRREAEREKRYALAREIAAENAVAAEPLMDEDVSQHARAEPAPWKSSSIAAPSESPIAHEGRAESVSDMVDWSESDGEVEGQTGSSRPSLLPTPTGEALSSQRAESSSSLAHVQDVEEEDTFEDVDVGARSHPAPLLPETRMDDSLTAQYILSAEDEGGHTGHDDGNDENQVDEYGYLSDSDEELVRQLAIEAEEHARFASSLNHSKTPAEVARDYESELKQLRNQQKKDRRDADEVTQTMIQECQALLRLFGLPYMTAPMEAEAQCAELVRLGLVDGIVTDDSDIFLFGGTRVYKNMFNAARFVECYLAADLEKEYALDRKKLIRFAHLLGSDYTEGIPGVGPVTALEIITDFETLDEFKEWCAKVQLGRPQDLEGQLTTPFRRKFKSTVQKRLFLPPGFPDARVDQAYLQPEVDSNPEEFQWGVPDLDKLRSFLMATIGWSQERTDEVLVPVIRDMNRREAEGTQANITRFFTGGAGAGAGAAPAVPKEGTAPRNRTGKESGRMARAYTRLRGEARKRRRGEEAVHDTVAAGGHPPDENETVEEQEVVQQSQNPRTGQKQKQKRKLAVDSQEGHASEGDADELETNDGHESDDIIPWTKSNVQNKRPRRTRRDIVSEG